MAGGVNARIVVIPTAIITAPRYYQLHTGDTLDTVTRVAKIAPVALPAQ
jgi:hypothetical protein